MKTERPFSSSFSSGVLSGKPLLIQTYRDRIQSDIQQYADSHWTFHHNDAWFHIARQYGKELAAEGDHLVVCGIGGSGLGIRALSQWILPVGQWSRVEVLDHLDAQYLSQWRQTVDLSRCVFCVISKSGSTVETLAMWMYLLSSLPQVDLRVKTVVISDPTRNPLTTWASAAGFRLAIIPEHVGGRFSALTSVGLIPLSFLGQDISIIQEALQDEFQLFQKSLQKPESYSSALQDAAAVTCQYNTQQMRQWVLMAYSKKFFGFTQWAAQLVAESLGKNKKTGILPLPAQGVTDQHSYLQYLLEGPDTTLTTFFEFPESELSLKTGMPPQGAKDPMWRLLQNRSLSDLHQIECRSTQQALDIASRPYQRVVFCDNNLYAVVRWMVYFQHLMATLGVMLNINPYDQPGVEIGKKETLKRLS